MIKWTLPGLSADDVNKLLNAFNLLGSDFEEINRRYAELMIPYRRDLFNNNPDYRGVFYDAIPMILLHHISPDLLNYYCYNDARIEYRENTIFRDDYVRYRRNFINENDARKRRFKQYLAERNKSEAEYWIEFLASCKAREFSFTAEYIDKFVPFPDRANDPLGWCRRWNTVHLPAVETVSHDMCYTEIY